MMRRVVVFPAVAACKDEQAGSWTTSRGVYCDELEFHRKQTGHLLDEFGAALRATAESEPPIQVTAPRPMQASAR